VAARATGDVLALPSASREFHIHNLGFQLEPLNMKVKAVLTMLFVMFWCSTASAETKWVQRFLERYQQPQPAQRQSSVNAPPATKNTLPALVGSMPLTTEDIVTLVLQNNRDVIVSRLSPISSFYTITSLNRPFEPNFHIIANVDRANSPSRSQLTGAPSLLSLTQDYRVGFDQTLQTGTIYSVDFDLNRSSSNSSFNLFNPSYTGLVTYSFTQHVLRDFGRRTNTHQIRVARNNEKISELQFETEIMDLVTQAQQSYWDLVFANEDLKVKQRSLDLAAKTLSDNKIQVDIGTLAPIDLVQAEAEVATRNEDLITAQYTIEQQQDALKKLISIETDPGLVLAHLSPIEPIPQPGSRTLLPLEQAIQYALENRPELKQATYDVENQDINIQYTKNQTLPILDITGSYTQSGLGGTQTQRSGLGQSAAIIEVIPGGVSDVFGQLFRFNFTGYSAGFTLQIPVRNRAAHAEYSRAQNERELATSRKAALAQRIALEVRNAYTQVNMQNARVNTARTAHELAARRLEAEQKKFELGTSTVRFVLEEQSNLAEAETNEIQAIINYTKALLTYDRAIGNTLERNNIELEKQLPKKIIGAN
jgi:outer membrane protein